MIDILVVLQTIKKLSVLIQINFIVKIKWFIVNLTVSQYNKFLWIKKNSSLFVTEIK